MSTTLQETIPGIIGPSKKTVVFTLLQPATSQSSGDVTKNNPVVITKTSGRTPLIVKSAGTVPITNEVLKGQKGAKVLKVVYTEPAPCFVLKDNKDILGQTFGTCKSNFT